VHITLEIPSGPYARFDENLSVVGPIPVRIEGEDEPIVGRVLASDVTPRAIRLTLELGVLDEIVARRISRQLVAF
jgi:hypothetical protein